MVFWVPGLVALEVGVRVLLSSLVWTLSACILPHSEASVPMISQVTDLYLLRTRQHSFFLPWNTPYLGKKLNFMKQMRLGSADSISGSLCSLLVRGIFRCEAQATGILCMGEAQQFSKPFSISLASMWLQWSLAAPGWPLNRQHRMCQEQKSFNICKRLLWLLQGACYFGNSVVIATLSRQCNS